MFCPKCGKEVEDDAVVCVHCGRPLEMNYRQHQQTQNADYNQSKTALGVVMGMFLGVIGLIIGICMYPEGTVARKTFMKAWIITFVVEIAVVVVFYVVFFVLAMSTVGSMVP